MRASAGPAHTAVPAAVSAAVSATAARRAG
jgi:hypothetical protein